MIYDVTIITVKPATQDAALAKLKDTLPAASSGGQLLACWVSDLGALNQVLVLRRYDDAVRMLAGRSAVLQSGNPFGIGDLIVGMTMDTYVPFPVREEIETGAFGPFYEVRNYEFKPDGLTPTIEMWNTAVPARAAISPVLAAMYSLTGAPRFMHIWPYRSLDERQKLRAHAIASGVWPPPGGPDKFLTQQTDIYLPAPFSPLR